MRTIEISDAVWAAIAEKGKFGETEDGVLRRQFGLPQNGSAEELPRPRNGGLNPARARRQTESPRQPFATQRMTSFVRDRTLVVEFHGGARKSFALPVVSDKALLRRVRDQAVEFARDSGGSYGQEMAVKKALTEAGYHLIK